MPAKMTPIATLAPGSNQLALAGLTPQATYTAVVAHCEPAPAVGYTQPGQVTFATGAGSSTAAAPDDPIAFCVAYPGKGVLSIGVAAYQRELVPGTCLVFNEAVETGVGTNTYGSFSEVFRTLTDPNTWGVYLWQAPLDGLHRMYQVFADRPGVTASAPTQSVIVLPGTAQPPQDYPVAIPASLLISQVEVVAPDRLTLALVATYTPPTDHQFDHMEYLVQPSLAGGGYGTGQMIVGSNQGNDVLLALPAGSVAAGSSYLITPFTITKGSPAGAFLPGVPILPTRTAGGAQGLTVNPIPVNPTVSAQTGNGTISYVVNFPAGCAFVRMYLKDEGTSNPGTVDSVEDPANVVAPDIVPPAAGSQVTKTVTVTSGHYYAATFVPYSSAVIRAPQIDVLTIVTLASGAAPPSAPTVAVATFTGSGGGNWAFPNWVGIKVTFVTAPVAGDTIALYRGGVQVNSYTVVSADVTNGYAIVFDSTALYPNTYSYSALQVSQTAGSSALSGTTSVTMRAGFTLPTPTVSFIAGSGPYAAYVHTVASALNLPPTAQCDVQYSFTSSGGPWTDLGLAQITQNRGLPSFPGPSGGFVYVQATVQAPGYTTSGIGTGSTFVA